MNYRDPDGIGHTAAVLTLILIILCLGWWASPYLNAHRFSETVIKCQ